MAEKPDLSSALGMEFVPTSEDDICMARMHVDERNRQPFGFLSGGATLALAKTLAGFGSTCLCPDQISMGINVSGQHLKAAVEGDTVIAKATLKHKGNTIHVWDVEVKNSAGELISTVSVTNYIINKNK